MGFASDNHACPIAKIEMYQLIYFKNIIDEMRDLQITTFEVMLWIVRLATKVSETEKVKITKEYLENISNAEEFQELQKRLKDALRIFRSRVIEKYSPKFGL